MPLSQRRFLALKDFSVLVEAEVEVLGFRNKDFIDLEVDWSELVHGVKEEVLDRL